MNDKYLVLFVSVYQLLGAKFCHDIATPLNALGLTLEMLPADKSILLLTQQAHKALVNLLNLYRILFAEYSPPLAVVTKVIHQICDQKQINYANKIMRDENRVDIGKIITCLFFHILPRLNANNSLLIEQLPDQSTSDKDIYKVSCEFSTYPADIMLKITPNNNNSKNAPVILLNYLLDATALRVSAACVKIDCGMQLSFTIS
ncbi:MAG: hypothetical protein LBJ89_02865 [Holosporales bacterium]|nr:hypothetical protein [Holosporales bacterium]